MLHITISGPKHYEGEETFCLVDIWRKWKDREPFQKCYDVKTEDYGEALKAAVELIKREKLDK